MTIGLIGRFTLQRNLMRANLVYRYTVLEILTCLSLYCLGRWLSGRAGGGYLTASLMFIIIYPFPAFIPSYLQYYFFTLEPHVSSFLEPDIITMTQGFCSVSLVYAFALGLLMIGRQVRTGGPAFWLPLLLGLMVAAEMRFRIHVFLPLMPGFLLLMVYFWIRSRKWSFAMAIAACLVVSALLRLEMGSAAYLKSSSKVLFTYNRLSRSVPWLTLWPYHKEIQDWMLRRLGDTTPFNWTWQVVNMTAFVCLNICGIPMMIAVFIYLARTKSWTDHLPLTIMMLSLGLGSLAGGILLNTTYDTYSLGGEMLINVAVYAFPVYCLLIWQIRELAMDEMESATGRSHVSSVTVGFVHWRDGAVRCLPDPLTLRAQPYTLGGRSCFPRAAHGALAYLHDYTPPDSIVASTTILNPSTSIYSGVGGRACYVEYFDAPGFGSTSGRGHDKDEGRRRLLRIWNARSETEMRQALDETPINYLVEYPEHPLWMRPPGCLHGHGKGLIVTVGRSQSGRFSAPRNSRDLPQCSGESAFFVTSPPV